MRYKEQEKTPRPEYPRPQFIREDNWLNINGEWDFTFDDLDIGLKERWYKKGASSNFDKKIVVPFCFQSKLSGIEDNSFHEVIWYRREFEIPREFSDKKIILHFGAVDYSCTVYLNGEFVGSHQGGYIGFSLDITEFVEESNILVLRVEDPSQSLEIPRGKQYWRKDLETIFYPRVSGIWQTVWIEFVSSDFHLTRLKMTPDIDNSEVIFEFDIHAKDFSDIFLTAEILFENQIIIKEDIELDFLGKVEDVEIKLEFVGRLFPKNPNNFKLKVQIPNNSIFLWDTEKPNLYDVILKIYNRNTGMIYDEVKSYFGLRKISVSDGKQKENKQILLNNNPIYQKLFLVQGYWPDGLYTAPSENAIIKDIQYIKDFGFNGLRTHQKAFDPLFLHWCDKMGVLVWGEIGNARIFTVDSQMRLLNEFIEEIERDYNHPSIIVWVPINESWGVFSPRRDPKRAAYTLSLYHLIKSIDSTRLVVDDDGWWHTKTDICTRHYYSITKSIHLPNSLTEEKQTHEKSRIEIYLKPHKYIDEPIIYSEIGGFGYDIDKNIENKWGYGKLIESKEEFFKMVLSLLKEFEKRKDWIQGFCYTELYDQYQEINGLLTLNREPKFPPAKLKEELDKMFY
ncbi:MAG: glycoside hydrolase family 2 protein [Promethearchaeota archaeon]|jgi:beta-galactosidase/beta-glucuronidase